MIKEDCRIGGPFPNMIVSAHLAQRSKSFLVLDSSKLWNVGGPIGRNLRSKGVQRANQRERHAKQIRAISDGPTNRDSACASTDSRELALGGSLVNQVFAAFNEILPGVWLVGLLTGPVLLVAVNSAASYVGNGQPDPMFQESSVYRLITRLVDNTIRPVAIQQSGMGAILLKTLQADDR
jgi:hypothetical protein